MQRDRHLTVITGLMLVEPAYHRGRMAQPELSDSPRITQDCCGLLIASGALAARRQGNL